MLFVISLLTAVLAIHRASSANRGDPGSELLRVRGRDAIILSGNASLEIRPAGSPPGMLEWNHAAALAAMR